MSKRRDLMQFAAEAGHAQPSTTLATYTQVYDKRRKEIRSQMSKELYE